MRFKNKKTGNEWDITDPALLKLIKKDADFEALESEAAPEETPAGTQELPPEEQPAAAPEPKKTRAGKSERAKANDKGSAETP